MSVKHIAVSCMNPFLKLLENSLNHKKGPELAELEIQLLLNSISQTEYMADAEPFFKDLKVMCDVLKRAQLSQEAFAKPVLRQLIEVFSQVDDEEVKRFVYDRIKLGDS